MAIRSCRRRNLPPGMRVAGAANGAMTLAAALGQGHRAAGALSCEDLGLPEAMVQPPPRADDEPSAGSRLLVRAWQDQPGLRRPAERCHGQGPAFGRAGRFQRRRTRQALHHPRHGHRPGQDRQRAGDRESSLGGARCLPIAEIGTTVFRPPYTPVPIAALRRARTRQGFSASAPDARPPMGDGAGRCLSSRRGSGCAPSGFPGRARRTGANRLTGRCGRPGRRWASAMSPHSARSRSTGPTPPPS